MIYFKKGNLIVDAQQGIYDYIIHGCNCFNTMGAGIAVQIAKTYPDAEIADKRGYSGDNKKLGDYTLAAVDIPSAHRRMYVINAYTQFHPGADFKMFALQMFLYRFKQDQQLVDTQDLNLIRGHRIQIGMPWIGCGIGGAQRRDVKKVLTMWAAQTPQVDLTVVALNDKHQLI